MAQHLLLDVETQGTTLFLHGVDGVVREVAQDAFQRGNLRLDFDGLVHLSRDDLDVRRQREDYFVYNATHDGRRREYGARDFAFRFTADGVEQDVQRFLTALGSRGGFVDKAGRLGEALLDFFVVDGRRDGIEQLFGQLAETDLRTEQVVVVVGERTASRSQVFQARVDNLLLAQHVPFAFQALFFAHVDFQTDDLVGRPVDDNRDEVVLIDENLLVVLDVDARLFFGNLVVVGILEGRENLAAAVFARFDFFGLDGVRCVSRLVEVPAHGDVFQVLRQVDPVFVLGPELEGQRVDQGGVNVFGFLRPLFRNVEAFLVADEVLLVFRELTVEGLDPLLVEQQVRLVAEQQYVDGCRERLLQREDADVEGVQFILDFHLHVRVGGFLLGVNFGEQLLDIDVGNIGFAHLEDLLRSGVRKYDVAFGIVVDDAVTHVQDESVEEPPRTLVLERDRSKILTAEDGDENRAVLEPLQERDVVVGVLEAVGKRHDEVEYHREEYRKGECREHVGVNLDQRLVAGLQAPLQHHIERHEEFGDDEQEE